MTPHAPLAGGERGQECDFNKACGSEKAPDTEVAVDGESRAAPLLAGRCSLPCVKGVRQNTKGFVGGTHCKCRDNFSISNSK